MATQSSPSHNRDWPTYQSPVNLQEIAPYLASHPDQDLASYVRTGLMSGFRVGYTRPREQLRSRNKNHPSALANEKVIDERIVAELAAGRLLGPITPQYIPYVHISPLGLVPKARQINKWRMICDLSAPSGSSVNDGIPPGLCSLRYAKVDDAVSIIQQLGRGTQLVKLDVKDAYRIVPVHPADYHLLDIRWKGKTYVDRALPFGLRSAPKIFNAIADILAWALHCQGITYQLHYLDDFLFLSTPNTSQGQTFLATATQTMSKLGIPVAVNKTDVQHV